MSERSEITLAYLINQYPMVSHAFIRREILAMEAQGLRVIRYTLRSTTGSLADELDELERDKTRGILEVGPFGMLAGLVRAAVSNPLRFARAMMLAMKVGFRSDRGLFCHLVYLAEASILRGWLEEEDVAHLHAHFGTNPTTVAMLCHELGGPPYSFTAHGSAEFDRLDQIKISEKIQHAAFVVAVSKFGRSQLYRKCPPDQWKKIHIIHCGVDEGLLQEPPRNVPDVTKMTCVGRLCEQKGQLLLIEAAKILKDRGLDFAITLVGDGEMRDDLEHAMREAGVGDRIFITGWADGDEVARHIAESRVFILPSFVEGLPVVIMEAFALGRPVISTYVGGIPELVHPGVNGWLVSPGDVDSLVQAMQQALQTSTGELTKMGLDGRSIVEAEHSALIEAGKLAELVHHNVKTHGGG